MKLATRADGERDGRLAIVSRDLRRMEDAEAARTVQMALDDWDSLRPALEAQYAALNANDQLGEPFDVKRCLAVMPRSFQFLDASAFLAHNHFLAEAWGFPRRTEVDPPLMYQGLSDSFFPPHGAVPFRSEADAIDFEAEFGVILGRTPLGVSPDEALGHVRLVLMLNDWSLRAFGPLEMRGGFGFLHAKPPSTLSAVAVTPDELGDAWQEGRVALTLEVHRGDVLFGRPSGAAMSYGFGQLISHAAATRDLCAGTVLGSGTVANFNADEVGSGCIAERVALDTVKPGTSPTPYLAFGERVRLEAFDEAGRSVFGSIDQWVAPRAVP